MKNTKYIIAKFLVILLVVSSCQDEDLEFGELTTPSNIDITVTYLDDTDGDGEPEETVAPGLGSGEVKISVSADDAISYHVVVQGQTKLQESGSVSHIFSVLGTNTYEITAIAFGPGGVPSTKTIEIEVLSLYAPPEDLLQMLYGDGTRSWRIKNEAPQHFGLGPAGGDNPFEFYGANPNDKVGVGMYDDRYIFNEDGTFTHIVDNTNDDPDIDPTGTVFGREGLINELGGTGGGTQNGADIENYGYEDYEASWSLSAPGGAETISLSGIAFFGYYVGGDHKYVIISRSSNEMVIKTTDGNGEFNWGFTLIAD